MLTSCSLIINAGDGDGDDFGDDDDGDVKLYEICDDDLEVIN